MHLIIKKKFRSAMRAGDKFKRQKFLKVKFQLNYIYMLMFSPGICLYQLDSNSGSQLNMSGWNRAGLHQRRKSETALVTTTD